MKLTTAAFALTITVIVSLVFGGCANSDSPTSPGASFQPRGVVLQKNGTDVVVVDTAGRVTGTIDVDEGGLADLSVLFVLADGTRGVPTTADHALLASIADGRATVVTTPWRVTITGVSAGQTSLTVSLSESGTTIYTSAAIPVRITHVPGSPEVGDTLAYTTQDRDANNALTGPVVKRDWFVLQTGVNAFGRDDVTEVREVIYDGTGTTIASVDTLWFSTSVDGSVYQYNLLHTLLLRIENGSAFVDLVPDQWVKICDTKLPAGSTWSGITPDSIVLKSISLSGAPAPVDITFRIASTTTGSHAITTPAGTYNAFHADHTLKINIKLSGIFPLPVLDSAVSASFDYAPTVGVVKSYLQGLDLVASLAGQTVTQSVLGFDLVLAAVHRKQ